MAEVDSRPQLEPEQLHGRTDVESTSDRVGGVVEDREEAVAGSVHQLTPVPRESLAHERVILLEQLCSGAIAEGDCQRGRLDDVGEADGREPPSRLFTSCDRPHHLASAAPAHDIPSGMCVASLSPADLGGVRTAPEATASNYRLIGLRLTGSIAVDGASRVAPPPVRKTW